MAELTRVSQTITVAWIEAAVRGLDQVEQGMRQKSAALFVARCLRRRPICSITFAMRHFLPIFDI